LHKGPLSNVCIGQNMEPKDHKADLSAELLEPASSPFDSLKTWHHCNILRNTNGRKTLISGATKTGMFTNCTKQIVDLNIGAYEQIFC